MSKTVNSTQEATITEVGYVTSLKNYLLVLNGLPNAKINEIIVNQNGVRAIVTSLKDSSIEALLLDNEEIQPNEMLSRTFKQLNVDVGPHLLGRMIDPLGIPIDGKQRFPKSNTTLPLNSVAGVIKQPFETGIIKVDMLVPIAKGQREMVIGSARSGKTSFIIDTIINQKNSKSPVICVYALIGKPLVEVRRIIDTLSVNKALDYTVVVSTASSDPASMIYLTPFVAMTIAEYFQRQARDILLVLDDLGTHAKFYREISLLGSRTPGRESYPADVFSQHAALIERAGNFLPEYGGGSITALPLIETGLDDYASFIPTNLMAMTDGHLMFNSSLYHKGVRPAVDIPLSVSRVGRQTQTVLEKRLADRVKSTLAQATKLEALSRFGSEVSAETQNLLNQGKSVTAILNQAALTKVPRTAQVALLALVFTKFFDGKGDDFVENCKQKVISYFTGNEAKLTPEIAKMQDENQLITYISSLVPELEKTCQQYKT